MAIDVQINIPIQGNPPHIVAHQGPSGGVDYQLLNDPLPPPPIPPVIIQQQRIETKPECSNDTKLGMCFLTVLALCYFVGGITTFVRDDNSDGAYAILGSGAFFILLSCGGWYWYNRSSFHV